MSAIDQAPKRPPPLDAGELAERIRDTSGVTTGHWIEINILDAATIYASADSAYDYARFKSEILGKEISWPEVRTALHVKKLDPEDFPKLAETIERQRGLPAKLALADETLSTPRNTVGDASGLV